MRSELRPLFLALAIALAVAGVAAAAAPAPPTDPDAPGLLPSQRLAALLSRVKAEQQKIRSLEAEFIQHRESAFLMLPQDSRGVFSYVAPDRVRWEYLAPKQISLLINGEEMTTWFHDLKRVDRMKIGRYSNQVFKYLNASSSLESLVRYFEVQLDYVAKGEPYRLALTPRFARVEKRLRSMTLWIDRALFLPIRVRYTEGDGDVTEYRFERLRLNGTLPDSRFQLDLPKDVEVRVLDFDKGGALP